MCICAYKFLGKSVPLFAKIRRGGKVGLYSEDIMVSSGKDSVQYMNGKESVYERY